MNTIPALKSTMIIEMSDPGLPETRLASGKPRVWTTFAAWIIAVIVGYLAVIAGYIAVGVGIGFVMGAQGMDAALIEARVQDTFQHPFTALLLSLLPFQLGIGAVVLFAARRSPEPMNQRLGLLPPSGSTFGGLRLAALAAFTVATALVSLIGSTLLFGEAPQDPISSVIDGGSWWMITLLSILLSTIPAVVEELLFRGYIQRRLLQRWSPIAAIGLSTMLFAVVHADSLQHMLAVVPLGVITGLLAYRTNSIKPGMLVHAVHNTAVVGFGALVNGLSPLMSDESLGLVVIGTITVLGLIGLPASLSLLRRNRSQGAPQMDVMPSTAMDSLMSQTA